MTATRDPERMIHVFLLEGAEQMQDQVYDAIRAQVDLRPQRAVIGPWRVPALNKFVPIGLGAVAVVAVLFVGSRFIGSPTPNVGGPPSQASASAAASEAPASGAPSSITPPPLTQTFTSPLHGISLSYPEGWLAQAATEPWTSPTFPFVYDSPEVDFLHEASGFNLNLVFASRPIGNSTPEDWIAEQMAGPEGCTGTEPITLDGATGLIGAGNCKVAVVTTEGRGYMILAGISPDDPSNAFTYGRDWFEEVLATVQLHPEDAVDAAPSAAP
ncbi:MAG TPA: hypothetical protein VFV72_12635 [Candidatus Limnocylindrales bacterium]|nr:hypothetical protein [Candidatus Limnocylindrales bacterium]